MVKLPNKKVETEKSTIQEIRERIPLLDQEQKAILVLRLKEILYKTELVSAHPQTTAQATR